jgi:hypothetical protein
MGLSFSIYVDEKLTLVFMVAGLQGHQKRLDPLRLIIFNLRE